MNISENKMRHCLGVANLMFDIATNVCGWSATRCRDMFVLGLLHDIGYRFTQEQCEHARIGGEVLKTSGYKYWKEVFYHGLATKEYSSEELNLLNMADLSVDSQGNSVSAQQRLEGVASRYGVDSEQYTNACTLAELHELL